MLSVIIGTDENAIIEVLAGHINYERQEIKKMYKTMFGQVYNGSREFWITVITIYKVNKTIKTFVSNRICIVHLQASEELVVLVLSLAKWYYTCPVTRDQSFLIL